MLRSCRTSNSSINKQGVSFSSTIHNNKMHRRLPWLVASIINHHSTSSREQQSAWDILLAAKLTKESNVKKPRPNESNNNAKKPRIESNNNAKKPSANESNNNAKKLSANVKKLSAKENNQSNESNNNESNNNAKKLSANENNESNNNAKKLSANNSNEPTTPLHPENPFR